MKLTLLKVLVLLFVIVFSSCENKPKRSIKNNRKPTPPFSPVAKPVFVAQNAYNYIQKQVDFGPRVPGTKEHKLCADFLEKEMQTLGLQASIQIGKTEDFKGNEIPIYNITGKFAPKNKNRIMLFAHWDTRPIADRDTKDKDKPIMGANDGASGVGVILEMIRAIMHDSLKPKIGIDFVFFDAEDGGKSGGVSDAGTSTWCLGSQYWAKYLPQDYVKPKYGILLDMVGAADAVFPIEEQSKKFNSPLVSKVWYLADKLGHGKYFVQEFAGGITDDHVQVSLAGIPSIDIIHYHPRKRDFGHFHHRHSDNMDIISKPTLNAVGETMLEVIYREK